MPDKARPSNTSDPFQPSILSAIAQKSRQHNALGPSEKREEENCKEQGHRTPSLEQRKISRASQKSLSRSKRKRTRNSRIHQRPNT